MEERLQKFSVILNISKIIQKKFNMPITNRKGHQIFLLFHEIQDYSQEIEYVKIKKRRSPKCSLNSRRLSLLASLRVDMKSLKFNSASSASISTKAIHSFLTTFSSRWTYLSPMVRNCELYKIHLLPMIV